MADELDSEVLIPNERTTETLEEPGIRQSRTLTCDKKTAMPILSVFIALLIAGQAVSVYFITQQQSTISDLSQTTTTLKLNELIKRLPGSPSTQNRQKLRMATFNIPLAFSDTDGSTQDLYAIAEKSNHIEDAVKYMLLRTNPLRTYPSLNGTFLERLRKLRKSLNDQEWLAFDAWMQQWYLFFLVQNSGTPKPTPTGTRDFLKLWKKDYGQTGRGPSGNLVYASTSHFTETEPSIIAESPSGASLISECLQKASVQVLPGAYRPQCDEKGGYSPKQCWKSTGFCWCVYKNGTEIMGTASRGRIECTEFEDPLLFNYED